MNLKTAGKRLGFASLVAALLASGCRKGGDETAWWQGEQQRLELAHDLDLKDYRYEKADLRSFEELEKLRASNESDRKRLLDLSREQTALISEVDSIERQLLAVGGERIVKQRQMALGKKFKEFPVADGRTLKNATVAAVDDAGVTIRHEDGSARLVYADLDDRQRQFFALDEHASLAAQEVERRQAIAYELWIDNTVALKQAKNEQVALEARRQEQRIRQELSLIAARQTRPSNARTLAQPARTFSSGYSSYSRPNYRYIYHYNYNPCGYSPYVNRNHRACYQPYQRISPSSAVNPTTTNRAKSFATTTIPHIP